MWILQLFLRFQTVLPTPIHLPVHTNEVSVCKYLKKNPWNFDWDCIASINQFGENWHCNTVRLPIHEQGTCLHLFIFSLVSFISVCSFNIYTLHILIPIVRIEKYSCLLHVNFISCVLDKLTYFKVFFCKFLCILHIDNHIACE